MSRRGGPATVHGESPIGDAPPSPLARSTRLLDDLELEDDFGATMYEQDDAFLCVQDLLQISIDRSDDTRLLFKVVSGEVKIDVDAANKVISHCSVREESRVVHEDNLLGTLKELKEGKLADTLLAFNEIDSEERRFAKSPRETRAFYERNPSSSARADTAHPPPSSAYRNRSRLSGYGDRPTPTPPSQRRPVTTAAPARGNSAASQRRAQTTIPRGRKKKKRTQRLPGYTQFKSQNTNPRSSPYGGAPVTLPALGRTGNNTRRGPASARKGATQRNGTASAPRRGGGAANGRDSAASRRSTARPASSSAAARTPAQQNGHDEDGFDDDDGERRIGHDQWRAELATYESEIKETGGVQSRGGEPYAVLLGYVVKARTAFHEALKEVDDLAAEAYAAEYADTVSKKKNKRGAGESKNIEEYYSLVEYVELREATARDARENAAREAHEQDKSARMIQKEYREHREREEAKQRQDLEYNAAVTIQKMVRGYLVRKQRMSAVRLAQLGKKYKLAKVKLWVYRLYVRIAMKRYKAIDNANTARWRQEHQGACVYQARHVQSLEQNAKQSVAVATQLSQWRAAIKMQVLARAFLAKCAVVNRQRAVVVIQSYMRMWLARDRVFWLKEYAKLRAERKVKSDWILARQRNIVVYPLENEMILRHILLTKEHHYAEREMRKEKQRFEQSWHVWCKHMKKFCLNQPLREEWAPQLDSTSGSTFYVNTVTGQRQTEHPHMLYVQINKEKSRIEAQAKFEEQIKPLLDYQEELLESQRRNKFYFEEKIARRRTATARMQEQSRTNVNVDHHGAPVQPFDSTALLFIEDDDLGEGGSEAGDTTPIRPLSRASSGAGERTPVRAASRASVRSEKEGGEGSQAGDNKSDRAVSTKAQSPRDSPRSQSPRESPRTQSPRPGSTAAASPSPEPAPAKSPSPEPAPAKPAASEPAPVSDDDDDSDAPDLERERIEEEV